MSKKDLWFGMLEAGERSSPVIRSNKLHTGLSDTIYLFNLQRNAILEYKSAIVEPKLRELNGDESELEKELQKAFNKVVKDFTPRAKTASSEVTEKPVETGKRQPADNLDIDIDDDTDYDDEDD